MTTKNGMHIAVVGPIAPFRSGVAKHTTELVRALAAFAGTAAVVHSFSRQYPSMLFPGADDRSSDGRVPDGLNVEFSIDSINPFTWWRTASRIKRQGATMVLMPAWTFFLAPCLGSIARKCRKAGIPVVMVVHNVVDHEASAWKSWLSQFQLKQADRYITHGQALRDRLRAMAGDKPITICPHPIFDQLPEPKRKLGRRAPVELLFFGLVRSYKGLDIALRGLASSGRTDIRMTVAGEFWEGRKEIDALIADLNLSERVELVPRYVSDAEAAEYFSRADAVVLPYRTVSGSGIVPVAYRYGKPVIVSDLPGLTEVVKHGVTGWIVPPENSDAIGRLLANVVTAERAESMKEGIAAMRADMSWARLAEAVLESDEP